MINSAFDGDFDINLMIMGITANNPKVRFIPYKTLIILDEIQHEIWAIRNYWLKNHIENY